jgi:glycine hydroxymethyltransferase
METVVDFIDIVLMNADDEARIQNVRNHVHDFMKDFPLYWELGY